LSRRRRSGLRSGGIRLAPASAHADGVGGRRLAVGTARYGRYRPPNHPQHSRIRGLERDVMSSGFNCGVNLLCLAGRTVVETPGAIAGAAASQARENLGTSVSEGAVRVLAYLATAWVNTPTPTAAQLFYLRGGSGSSLPVAAPSPAVEFAQTLMLPVTLGIMVIALTVAGIRMIIAGQRAGEEGRRILVGLVSMVAISSLGLLGFTLLIQASEATASWILDNAIDDNTVEGMADGLAIVFGALLATGAPGAGAAGIPAVLVIVGGIVLILISFVQIILMILRGGMLVVMAGLLPTVAAAATTQTGMEWLQRYIRWSFALILFK